MGVKIKVDVCFLGKRVIYIGNVYNINNDYDNGNINYNDVDKCW